jgi:hypothetical protein
MRNHNYNIIVIILPLGRLLGNRTKIAKNTTDTLYDSDIPNLYGAFSGMFYAYEQERELDERRPKHVYLRL